MNYSDYRFTLDIQIHQAQVSIPVTLNDTARKLCIGLTDGRKPYTIAEGCRAVFVAKKPDKNTIINDCIIERNTIIYEFSQNTTNAEGIINCEIRLIDADERVLTSPQFIIVVDKNVVRDEEVPLSESESTTLSRIISSEEARVAAEEKREELADFLANSGGVIVSEEEPSESLANVWVKTESSREMFLLDRTDIVQELSDDADKIPSVGLVKSALVQYGADGKDGVDGKDGYTPQRGVDYWTDADRAEINAYIDEQIGDIDTAIGRIIAIQRELIGVETITFTIIGVFDQSINYTLIAENGMTWGEWIESEYNTIGAYIPEISTSQTVAFPPTIEGSSGFTGVYKAYSDMEGIFDNAVATDVIESGYAYQAVGF